MKKSTIHVEVARKQKSAEKRSKIQLLVRAGLEKEEDLTKFNFEDFIVRNPNLKNHVQSIRLYIEDNGGESSKISPAGEQMNGDGHNNGTTINIHVYDLNDDGEEAEYMEDENESGDPSSASSHHWILPSASLNGLWDTLLFDHDIQSRLMKYINSALLFSEKGVDTNLISWNKVILLHGPAGTGKTSLCKALAQKATIRLGHRYKYGQLIEINSHSLFSKWFSESGKLVMKMFEKIHDLLEDPKCIVFLLIDEVESLAQCRTSADAGNEPTDSIRAVNALLTQIDRIKKFPNVVILTTSNMVGCIDLAFVDRADLKILIGPPPTDIIYRILASSINELIRVGIIESNFTLPIQNVICENLIDSLSPKYSKLLDISKLASGMSGRTLRKLPFLAHSNFITSTTSDLDAFLEVLKITVETEMKEVDALQKKSA